MAASSHGEHTWQTSLERKQGGSHCHHNNGFCCSQYRYGVLVLLSGYRLTKCGQAASHAGAEQQEQVSLWQHLSQQRKKVLKRQIQSPAPQRIRHCSQVLPCSHQSLCIWHILYSAWSHQKYIPPSRENDSSANWFTFSTRKSVLIFPLSPFSPGQFFHLFSCLPIFCPSFSYIYMFGICSLS